MRRVRSAGRDTRKPRHDYDHQSPEVQGLAARRPAIRLMMDIYDGEEPGAALGLIALVSAAAAAVLGAVYLKHVRRSQNTERMSK